MSLTALGITRDEDGELEAPTLQKLVSGAEAKPYLDATAGVVYKLFFLLVPAGDLGKEPGKLGKKLSFEPNVEGEFELTYCAALLEETVEKICILHDAGGHPTEIVGLSETADF